MTYARTCLHNLSERTVVHLLADKTNSLRREFSFHAFSKVRSLARSRGKKQRKLPRRIHSIYTPDECAPFFILTIGTIFKYFTISEHPTAFVIHLPVQTLFNATSSVDVVLLAIFGCFSTTGIFDIWELFEDLWEATLRLTVRRNILTPQHPTGLQGEDERSDSC